MVRSPRLLADQPDGAVPSAPWRRPRVSPLLRRPATSRFARSTAPAEPEVRGLEQLLETTMTFDGHRPMGEHALIELKQGPRAFPHAAFAAYVGGELAGYAHLSERPSAHGWRLEAFTAPAFRGRGVATTLLTSVNAHIASHGGGRIHVWAYHPGWAQGRLARRFGMRLIPHPVPDGTTPADRAGTAPGGVLGPVVFPGCGRRRVARTAQRGLRGSPRCRGLGRRRPCLASG